jgi:hypothetical protein
MTDQWYVRSASGVEKGPYSERAILDSLREGHVNARTMLRREGEVECLALADRREFQPNDPVLAKVVEPGVVAEAQATSSAPRPSSAPICGVCGGPVSPETKKTGLGFRRAPCRNCPNVEIVPLTTMYRIVYWVVVGWLGLHLTLGLSAVWRVRSPAAAEKFGRDLVMPLFIGCLSAYAIIKDSHLRARRKRAQRYHS